MLRHVDVVVEGELLVKLNDLAKENDEELETLIVALLEERLMPIPKEEPTYTDEAQEYYDFMENVMGALGEMVGCTVEEMRIEDKYLEDDKDFHLLQAMSVVRCWLDANKPNR
jgi:hypothetical protein